MSGIRTTKWTPHSPICQAQHLRRLTLAPIELGATTELHEALKGRSRMTHEHEVVPDFSTSVHTKLLAHNAMDLERGTKIHLRLRRIGFVALFAVIWSNIFQAESVQWLQTSLHFKKPFFIMCFSHAAPVVLLPLIFLYYRVYGGHDDRHAGFVSVLRHHTVIPFPKLLRLSAYFGAFYLVSDYFWFSSFKHLTVAAGAAIFNCSPLWVYCFSICLLHEKASAKKLCGVLTAFVGVTLVVMYQGDSSPSDLVNASVVAGLMMLTAATMNAIFQVSLALVVGDDMNDTATLFIFSGLCGIVALPLWFVGSIFFAYCPFPSLHEPFGFPDSVEGNAMLAIAIVMFVINFVALTISVCWTSPLETSVGFMLTIPLSGVMDTLIHHAAFSWQFILGSTLVMTGFAVLELSASKRR